MQVHFARINGGLSIQGGEGFFSTVEDNVIHGGATINGSGVLRTSFEDVPGVVEFRGGGPGVIATRLRR